MRNIIIFMLLAMLASGCVYPTSNIQTTDTRPAIAIAGAPEGAQLVVDGLDMGMASLYDGKKHVLLLEKGMHKICVQMGSMVIHSSEVFLDDGIRKTISVAGE